VTDLSVAVGARSASQQRFVGAVLLLLGCFAIQGSAAASTELFADMGAVGVVAWRQIVGALALLALFRPQMRGRGRSVWVVTLGLGVSMTAMSTGYFLTIERLPLGVAAALLYLGAFAVGLAGIRQWHLVIFPVLALAGVLAITRPDQTGGLSALGIGFGLVAAASLAAYTLTAHRLGTHANVGDLALAIAVSALLLAPVAATHPPDLSVRTLGTLALIGTLGVALAVSCDFLALRLAGTTVVGTLFALDPVVGAMVGLVVLGQGLPLAAVLGVAAISLAGIGLTAAPQESAD
jgi:inner membrane transporter RhtA